MAVTRTSSPEMFQLRSEIYMILNDMNYEFCQTQYFCDHEWSAQLTYVGDMFSELSYLNLILQTESANCFIVGDKITAFLEKLKFVAYSENYSF